MVFLLSACRTTKITGGKIEALNLDAIEQQMLAAQLQYNTFSAKSKMEITTPDGMQSISANIDMEKDKFIGISLRMLGIEGARIYITPDSIHIVDRLNQKYYPKDFTYLEETFGVTIDFNTLQNLIAGNLVFYAGSIYPGTADDEKYVLWANDGVFKNTIWLYPSFHVMRMQIEDFMHPRSMTLEYTGYNKVSSQAFAFLRHLQFSAVDNYDIGLEFTSLTLDEPVNFNFTVNPKYEVVH